MEQYSIPRLLLKLAPPVMLSLLIQSIYNIVDSYFVAQYSQDGLAALSIIFPIQLLITALGTGTGAGINILVSRLDGEGNKFQQQEIIKTGLFLGLFNFIIFAAFGCIGIASYFQISSDLPLVREAGISYGRIIFLFSIGLFLESNCTKILQARGNMIIPMCAQVVGALINIILDPILIFGYCGFPQLGVQGAAIATIIGQWIAMAIVLTAVLRPGALKGKIHIKTCLNIYRTGFPSIAMQSLYTLYIVGLNLILKGFTEDAVTVLGIYYKLQTFFFIPLFGLEQVVLPIISYHYGAQKYERIKETVKWSIMGSGVLLLAGTVIFIAAPDYLLSIFSDVSNIHNIGRPALRIIALSFLPVAYSSIYSAYFQGIGNGLESIILTLLRQVFLLVPLAWVFHYWGLIYVWWAFPVTEVITALCAFVLDKRNPLVRTAWEQAALSSK